MPAFDFFSKKQISWLTNQVVLTNKKSTLKIANGFVIQRRRSQKLPMTNAKFATVVK